MHIKKFTAASLKEAMVLMKNELGKDAVILGTRILDDENNKRQKLYEVTAGMDNFEFDGNSRNKAVKNGTTLRHRMLQMPWHKQNSYLFSG